MEGGKKLGGKWYTNLSFMVNFDKIAGIKNFYGMCSHDNESKLQVNPAIGIKCNILWYSYLECLTSGSGSAQPQIMRQNEEER